MEDLNLYLSILIFTFFLFGGIYLIAGYFSINYLYKVVDEENSKYPKVSIIIPARNEQKHIEEATLSRLKQDYPNFEVIIVNDRSDDNTKKILTCIKHDNPQLKIIDVGKVPDGWLGKNNAMQAGADNAEGELLLFSDADVIFEKDVLKKSVSYMLKNDLDNLTIAPDLIMPGVLLKMFTGVFMIYLSVYIQPWLAKYKWNNHGVGIGAFNLVKKEVYNKIGGHEKIKMRPEDDVKLGKLIKINGFAQEMLYGYKLVKVEWYSSLIEIINGLTKNTFAAINYSPLLLLIAIIGQITLNILPFILIFISNGYSLIFYLLSIFVIFIIFSGTTKFTKSKKWYAFAYPFMCLIFIYIQLRSMFFAIKNKGINWRETHYSLKELRKNKI